MYRAPSNLSANKKLQETVILYKVDPALRINQNKLLKLFYSSTSPNFGIN